VENLAKSFGSLHLFSNLNLDIKRGEHVSIIGDNGTGKTTLLKILNGLETADCGTFKLGTNVEIGYYDQEQQLLNPEKTLFEEISDTYPDMSNTKIRNTLAAFLFTGDDVFKQIKDLSGGEKGRLSLAKLMLSNANFIILDEPTNHLDIASKEILEDALNSYTGTVLYVSHDRYFINRTATRILELCGKEFYNYMGNYDYYLEKKITPAEEIIVKIETETESKQDWKDQKEEQARLRKRQNDLKKVEEQILKLENRNSEIENEMTKPEIFTNSVKCQELSMEQSKILEELELLYEQWELLAE
jgi:ATP-binding cassette subfamily F protein 3